MRAKALTKKALLSYGFVTMTYEEGRGWAVSREFRTASGSLQTSTVRQRMNNGIPSLTFTFQGKQVNLTAARAAYVWYFRDIYEDESVVPMDGNQKNVSLTNIVCVKREVAAEMARRSPEKCAADAEEYRKRIPVSSSMRKK